MRRRNKDVPLHSRLSAWIRKNMMTRQRSSTWSSLSTMSSGGLMTSSGEVMTSSGEVMASSGEVITSSGEVTASSGEAMTSSGKMMTSPGEMMTSTGEAITSTERLTTSTANLMKMAGPKTSAWITTPSTENKTAAPSVKVVLGEEVPVRVGLRPQALEDGIADQKCENRASDFIELNFKQQLQVLVPSTWTLVCYRYMRDSSKQENGKNDSTWSDPDLSFESFLYERSSLPSHQVDPRIRYWRSLSVGDLSSRERSMRSCRHCTPESLKQSKQALKKMQQQPHLPVSMLEIKTV